MFAKLLATFLVMVCLSSNAGLNLTNGSIVVFLGDSITKAHNFTSYMESYYTLRYPSLQFHFRDDGTGGKDLNYLITNRFNTYIYPYQASAVAILMTPNGGDTTNRFLTNLTYLATQQIIASNNSQVILLGCEPKDLANGSTTHRDRSLMHEVLGTANGYPWVNSFQRLNLWLTNFLNGHPIDMGWIDATHPGQAGHLTMAYVMLTNLNEDGLVSYASIDAAAQSATSQTNCTLGSLVSSATNVTFERLDTRLPMAWDDGASNGIVMYPGIITNLNRYIMVVSNLTAGTYTLKIDGTTVHTNLSDTTLSAGFNLATLTTGPIHDQLIETLGRIRDKLGVERAAPLVNLSPLQGVANYQNQAAVEWGNGLRGPDLIAALADEIAEIDTYDELINDSAQPVTRTFVLTSNAGGGGGGGGTTISTNSISGNVTFSGGVIIQ